MTHRPIPATMHRQPFEQLLVAFEQFLQRVHEHALAETPRPRQEIALPLSDHPGRETGLVHIESTRFAHLAESLHPQRQHPPTPDHAHAPLTAGPIPALRHCSQPARHPKPHPNPTRPAPGHKTRTSEKHHRMTHQKAPDLEPCGKSRGCWYDSQRMPPPPGPRTSNPAANQNWNGPPPDPEPRTLRQIKTGTARPVHWEQPGIAWGPMSGLSRFAQFDPSRAAGEATASGVRPVPGSGNRFLEGLVSGGVWRVVSSGVVVVRVFLSSDLA